MTYHYSLACTHSSCQVKTTCFDFANLISDQFHESFSALLSSHRLISSTSTLTTGATKSLLKSYTIPPQL